MTEENGAEPAPDDESQVKYHCSRVSYGLSLGIQVSRDEVQEILIPRKFLEKAMAQATVDDLPYISLKPSPNRQMYLDIPEEVQHIEENPPASEKG